MFSVNITNMQMHLEQHRPDKNRFRFYAVDLERDLFGTWIVIRRWGRIGASERRVTVSFETFEAAQSHVSAICHQKEKRGYVVLPLQLDLPLL